MKKLLLLLLFFAATDLYAQSDADDKPLFDEEEPASRVNFGLGIGMDYGGLGCKLSILPVKYVSVFGGVGYNLHKAAYNIGGTFRILPDKKVVPFLQAMYGYNAVIVVADAKDLSKTYYGTTIGGGIELNMRNSDDFFLFGLLIPFRSQQFKDDVEAMRNDPDMDFTDVLPFTVSFGYHFRF